MSVKVCECGTVIYNPRVFVTVFNKKRPFCTEECKTTWLKRQAFKRTAYWEYDYPIGEDSWIEMSKTSSSSR